MPLLNILLPVAAVALLCALWEAASRYVSRYNSSLRYMPGPPNRSWLKGNILDMRTEEPGVMQQRWAERYGHVLRFKGFVNV